MAAFGIRHEESGFVDGWYFERIARDDLLAWFRAGWPRERFAAVDLGAGSGHRVDAETRLRPANWEAWAKSAPDFAATDAYDAAMSGRMGHPGAREDLALRGIQGHPGAWSSHERVRRTEPRTRLALGPSVDSDFSYENEASSSSHYSSHSPRTEGPECESAPPLKGGALTRTPLPAGSRTGVSVGRQLVAVELPYPRHSGNRAVRHANGRHYLSATGLEYRRDVRRVLERARLADRGLVGPVVARWVLAPPDGRRRDQTNVLKVAEDAVVKAGLLIDDSNAVIAKTEVTWVQRAPGGRILLEIVSPAEFI